MAASDLRVHLSWCTRQAEHLELAIDGAHEQLVSAIAASPHPDHNPDVTDAHGHLADLRAEQALWLQLADETRRYLDATTSDDDTAALFADPTITRPAGQPAADIDVTTAEATTP